MSNNCLISIKNLKKEYISGGIHTQALNDISFELPSLGLIGINGKSSSGKTTLLQILAGFLPFDNGNVFIFNENISKWKNEQFDSYRQNDISYVFQDFNLIDSLTVYENICLSLDAIGKNITKEEVEKVLNELELCGITDKYPYELSGGERQRVAVAGALVKKPKIIFADEPTASLDYDNGKKMMEIFKKISKYYLVIIVTHETEFANEFCDRVITLENGKIISDICKKEEITQIDIVKTINKSRINFKSCLKMAIYGLKQRNKRIILSVLINGLLFGSTCVFSSLYFNNETEMIYNKLNNNVIIISNGVYGYDDIKIEKLEQRLIDFNYSFGEKGLSFKLHEKCDYNYVNEFLNKDNLGRYYFTNTINGYVICDDSFLDLGLSIVEGKFPTEENEVMISKYTFDDFKMFGFENYNVNKDLYELINIDGFEDIEGKCIYQNEYKFKIVGVVDTKMEKKRYEKLISFYYDFYFRGKMPDFSLSKKELQIYKEELIEELEYGIHNRLFINENHPYFQKLVDKTVDSIFVSLKNVPSYKRKKLLDDFFYYDYESPYENGVLSNKEQNELGKIYTLNRISIGRYKEFIVIAKPFLIGILVAFALISIVFSCSDIKLLLADQKWQLGVIRSKGYNRKDIFLILLMQPILVMIFSCFSVILCTILFSFFANSIFKSMLLFTISIFSINISIVLLFVLGNLFLSLMSSSILIYKIIKAPISDLLLKTPESY